MLLHVPGEKIKTFTINRFLINIQLDSNQKDFENKQLTNSMVI